MPDTTLMIAVACDADLQSYERHLMTLEDAIKEYEEFLTQQK